VSASSNSNQAYLAYRPEIDGLRAVAVLAVVLFHYFRESAPAGYLGVDIFFVLSGYLITSLIVNDLSNKKFSIVNFYNRRLRRIFPALIVVIIFSLFLGIVIFLPSNLIGLARSIIYALIFLANVYFWRDTNYFSPDAETKPLLHLWSLSVEEQFYIFFPLMLAFLVRRWLRGTLSVVVAMTFGSYLLSVAALKFGAGSPAFFLLPTRIWELGLGAMIALMPPARLGLRSSLIAFVGFLFMMGGLFFATDTVFPLMPSGTLAVIGAGLMIQFARDPKSTLVRLLRLRPMVFVGLISYSLYLWHWPIIVFVRYFLVRELTLIETFGCFLAAFSLASLSWRFVEKPFRNPAMPIKTVRWVAGLSSLAAVALSAAVIASDGLPSRLDTRAAMLNEAVGTNYRCPVANYLAFGASRACILNLPTRNIRDARAVLMGNSHAQMYAPVWEDIFEAHSLAGLLVPLNGCLPTVTANISVDCIAAASQNLAEIERLEAARIVVLGFNWEDRKNPLFDVKGNELPLPRISSLMVATDDLIDRLKKAGKSVILIAPIAQPGFDFASEASREIAFGLAPTHLNYRPRANFDAQFGSAIRHFEGRKDIKFVRPDTVQCIAEKCHFSINGKSLFADSNHIAEAELVRFREMFENALVSLDVAIPQAEGQ
jgi:peptidoglycan/LPS O-acetylase OafA/YrhL